MILFLTYKLCELCRNMINANLSDLHTIFIFLIRSLIKDFMRLILQLKFKVFNDLKLYEYEEC